MKTKLFCLLLSGALFLAQSPVALAQAQGSLREWSAVQAMATDERLIVKQKDGKTIEGRMIEASETNLTLSRNNKVVNIPRASIQRIEHSRGKAAKGKWALIGAGVGAGAGAAIGQSKVKSDAEIWLPVGLIFGTGIGAGVGALFGASRRNRTLIYEAP
jgi:Zn-dependent alcohol dehydrogenase